MCPLSEEVAELEVREKTVVESLLNVGADVQLYGLVCDDCCVDEVKTQVRLCKLASVLLDVL